MGVLTRRDPTVGCSENKNNLSRDRHVGPVALKENNKKMKSLRANN
jgi:hypothetical protein